MKYLILTVLSIFFAQGTKSPTLEDRTIPQVDQLVIDEMIKQNIPGVAVGVIENGKLTHLSGYGYTDLEKKTKVTTNTIFRWASISKTLTAVAALQMDEQLNDFSINDKVIDHFSHWRRAKDNEWHDKVTVKHLLLNRSGIQKYGKGRDNDGDGEPDKRYAYDSSKYKAASDGYNEKAAVDVFKKADLDFEPGDKYLYSSFGFNLLGSVLEVASPDGHVDWIKDNISNKVAVSKSSRMGYEKKCNGRINTSSIKSVEWKLPGGGWESNIGTLAQFTLDLMNEKLLDNTSRLWEGNSGGRYYYGIYKDGSKTSNNLRVWHGGSHGNLKTLMHFYPEQKKGVVIMAYSDHADCNQIANRIYRDYIGSPSNSQSKYPMNLCKDQDTKSCSGKFSGVWRKTNQRSIIRRGYSTKAFNTEWNFLRDNGYYCDDFEAYTVEGELMWDGIFKKGDKKDAMWRNFDQDGFNAKWKEQTNKGYRLIDLETYVVDGKRKWAGLFIGGSGKYAMFRNQSEEAFGEKHEKLAKEGMKLIDVEVYVSKGKRYWSGVWIAGKESLLNRNFETEKFGALRTKRKKQGFKLIDIECYKVNGKQYWAGIWEKSSSDEKLNRNYKYCDFMEKHNNYIKDGFELIDLEKY